MTPPDRQPRLIAIAVVERDGEFLIGQRPLHVALGGLWEFPGGKVEPGESPQQAAERECLEETGLAVEVVEVYRVDELDYAHDRLELHFFACRPISGSPSPREPYRWVPRRSLADYEFPAGNRGILEMLLAKEDSPANRP